MDEPLVERLKAIDEELGRVPLPRGLERRIVESTPPKSSGSWLVPLAATAAIVLAFVVGRRTAPVDDPVAAPELAVAPLVAPPTPVVVPPPLAGAPVEDPGCPRTLGDAPTSLAAGCRLALSSPALTIDAHEPSLVRRSAAGLRVVRGDVGFAVDEVAVGEPSVRIEVGAGTIEVWGTRFVVHEREGGGHVDLLEGSIAFATHDGATQRVTPGRRLAWVAGSVTSEPDPPVALPSSSGSPSTSPSSSRVPRGRALAPEAALDEVAALRRAGEYREAVALLRRVRAEVHGTAQAEILSYEEGTLREHFAANAAMCAYWRGHVQRFTEGSYADAVAARLRRFDCDVP